MKNTKIKTTGLKLILKEMGYKANAIVKPIPNGYRTILMAMSEDCLFEIYLTLKDYLFHEQSKVYVRCFNTKTNQDWEIEQDVVYSNEFNERKDIAMSIMNAIEFCNKNTKLFSLFTLKEMYVALTDVNKIKELYRMKKRISELYQEIDIAM